MNLSMTWRYKIALQNISPQRLLTERQDKLAPHSSMSLHFQAKKR